MAATGLFSFNKALNREIRMDSRQMAYLALLAWRMADPGLRVMAVVYSLTASSKLPSEKAAMARSRASLAWSSSSSVA